MSTAILTKTTKSGQLEVRLSESAVRQLAVTLDGKALCSGWLQALQQPQGDVTHHIGRKAGFTADEAATIEAAFRAACAPTLREQRAALWTTLRGLQDEQTAAYERGHLSDGSAAHAAAAQWNECIQAAEQAIRDFDQAHPEVAAELQAEKAERAARLERIG